MSEPARRRSGSAALFGWTNVGKSTLLNRLVGAKLAAVSSAAQTTRQRITGVVTTSAGQVAFVDTPGLHRPQHRMNRAMVDLARETLDGVDVAVFVLDAARGLGRGDLEAAAFARRAPGAHVAVPNKIDLLPDKSVLLPLIARLANELGFAEVVPVSAATGDGCARLLDTIVGLLPPGEPAFAEDYLTDQPERALAAEWIRERLLAETREELPHATAVVVERWEERADGLVSIEAAVLVDRESQRRIVIGREGALLKRVGTAARLEIERMIERRVYLSLWVKVRPDWREDPQFLAELGIE